METALLDAVDEAAPEVVVADEAAEEEVRFLVV